MSLNIHIPKGHVAHWRKTDKGYSVEFERFIAADQVSFNARAKDAERGSGLLLDAMKQQFFRLAAHHGVTVKDAQLLCMNSEGLCSRK